MPPARWSRALAWAAAALVALAAAVGLVNVVFEASLGRPLNLALDLYLIGAVWDLAVGNSGPVRSLVGILGMALAVVLLVGGVAWLLTPPKAADPLSSRGSRPAPAVAGLPLTRRTLSAALVGGTLGLGVLGSVVGPLGQRVAAPASRLVAEQLALARATRAERIVFEGDLERDPQAFAELPGLLAGLEGRSVVLSYIESYGMAALDDPELAAVVRPRLEAAERSVDSAGIHAATGVMLSPTTGGQSWYAHGTMLSGLWLENQLRYQLLITSSRETLVDDFERAGYRTVTVMPAITTAWPQGVRLGYDEIHTAETIPYEGPPFYWVTMPDQFTWAHVARVLAARSDPLFLETAMVTSHAPWAPVLPLLEWDDMGDGSAFEPFRVEGHPPEEIWWDVEALRQGYAHSIAYALDAAMGFAERYLDERTILVVVGDHQAAPWVTGAPEDDDRVPVHVLARDATLLEPFLAWGFTPGLEPAASAPAHRMDAFRGWFVRAFSGAPETP